MVSILLKALLALGTLVAAAPASIRRQTSSGCGQAPPANPGTFTSGTITVNAVDGVRQYGYWIPSTYKQSSPAPLIFSYHGAEGTIATQRALDGLTETFFNTDHIVVYLQGVSKLFILSLSCLYIQILTHEKTLDPNGFPSWEGSPGVEADDLGFTSAVLDVLESELCIDTNRIYATGKSDGGGFVNLMACSADLSTRVAAFAPVSGAYYNLDVNTSALCDPQTVALPCRPGRSNIPILAFHGGGDTTIPYEGKFQKKACLPSIPHWIDSWAQRDGLSTVPVNVSIPATDNGVNMTFGGARGIVELVYE
jgi:poly(3-hydroxybutyrate) depolymerase